MKHGPAVCLLRYFYSALSDAEDIYCVEWDGIVIMKDDSGTMWLETDVDYLKHSFEGITLLDASRDVGQDINAENLKFVSHLRKQKKS
jgi:hypothetical protein